MALLNLSSPTPIYMLHVYTMHNVAQMLESGIVNIQIQNGMKIVCEKKGSTF